MVNKIKNFLLRFIPIKMNKAQAINKLRSLRMECCMNDYSIQGTMSREQNPKVLKKAVKTWNYNRKKINRELTKIERWLMR